MAAPARREKLSDQPIQRFLATKEVVVLATIEPDGAPLAMPMWFLADGETLVMISVAGLRKLGNMHRDPRVAVVAESGNRGTEIKNLLVRGRVAFVPDGAERRALADRFVKKYHPHLEALWRGPV